MAVYFISDGEFVKIGYSVNPEERLGGIQTGSPKPLRLIASMPGDAELEQAFHQQFSKYRTVGEWFEITGLLAEFLSVITKVFPVKFRKVVTYQEEERRPPLLPGTLPDRDIVLYHFKRYIRNGGVVDFHETDQSIIIGLPATTPSGSNDIASLLNVIGDNGEPTPKWNREIRPRTMTDRLNESLLPLLYGLSGIKLATKPEYGCYVIIPRQVTT